MCGAREEIERIVAEVGLLVSIPWIRDRFIAQIKEWLNEHDRQIEARRPKPHRPDEQSPPEVREAWARYLLAENTPPHPGVGIHRPDHSLSGSYASLVAAYDAHPDVGGRVLPEADDPFGPSEIGDLSREIKEGDARKCKARDNPGHHAAWILLRMQAKEVIEEVIDDDPRDVNDINAERIAKALGRHLDRVQEDLASQRVVEAETGGGLVEANQIPGRPKKGKKSTVKGEARAKLISALTCHHQYADGGCLNDDPINSNKLAELADVARSTASEFLKKEFGGHRQYTQSCRQNGRLISKLKELNGDYPLDRLYGANPECDSRRDD